MIYLDLIERFDAFLAGRGLRFEAVVIGGGALILAGIIDRPTRDLDCLDPEIPEAISQAAKDFAAETPDLWDQWLNNGPRSLIRDLPPGWSEDLELVFEGRSLVLRTLGRMDTLRSKLFAYCDRQQDIDDCLALTPSVRELWDCLPWLVERDGNPKWPDHVRTSLQALARRLGHDIDLTG